VGKRGGKGKGVCPRGEKVGWVEGSAKTEKKNHVTTLFVPGLLEWEVLVCTLSCFWFVPFGGPVRWGFGLYLFGFWFVPFCGSFFLSFSFSLLFLRMEKETSRLMDSDDGMAVVRRRERNERERKEKKRKKLKEKERKERRRKKKEAREVNRKERKKIQKKKKKKKEGKKARKQESKNA